MEHISTLHKVAALSAAFQVAAVLKTDTGEFFHNKTGEVGVKST